MYSSSSVHPREDWMSNEIILVVDDSQQVTDFLVDGLLPVLGYQTLVAHNGKRALELVKARRPDLMLLDFQLSDTTGLEVLRQLAHEGHYIPTVLITAEGSERIAVDAFRLGVQDYLIKPVDADSLGAAITRALTETRLRREKASLTARLKQQVAWLTALSKVGRSVTSSLELDAVLRRIVEAGVYLTQAEEGFLALLDAQSDQLYLRAVKNIDREQSETMHLRVQDPLVGRAVNTRRPVRLARSAGAQPLKVSTGLLVHSLLHVPILSKDKVLGVLSVDNRIGRRVFTEIDETMLTSLADYAAVAIENADLYARAQQEIAERVRAETQIQASLKEKEVLLKEIHHRVKNNLQIISSLLNLQTDYVDDAQTSKALQDSQHRIRSMALIHEKLYRSRDLAHVDLVEYIQNLTAYLFRVYDANAEAVTLIVKGKDVFLDIDTAVPCGLIVNELISNSLKHAFPTGRDKPAGQTGQIRIELRQNDRQLTVMVSDNGVGLPPDFDFRHTSSLGLQLVNMLVAQLDGTIELDRRHPGLPGRAGGTTFIITFPIAHEKDCPT
jgi:two-component sensor histidine kinase/DNA-binding response OmpR family regulator